MRARMFLAVAVLAIAWSSQVFATKLYEVNVFKDNIIPFAYQDSIRIGRCTTPVQAYIQAAIDSLGTRGGIITFPTGKYPINAPLLLPGSTSKYVGTGKPVQLARISHHG